MNKYPLIGVSICAVILLVLGSLNTVVASNNSDIEGPFKSQQSSDQFTWSYIGLIFKVNRTNDGYVSFYTIFVFYTGAEPFEFTWMPVMGTSSFEKIVIPNTYDGILTKHIIFCSVLK